MTVHGAQSERENGHRGSPHVGFMVVGSARSGTTLVQRLLCEIPGVAMPPETHFFSQFAQGLLTRRRFPILGEVLREEVERFCSLDTSRDLGLDVDELTDALGGSCPGAFALFDAIVRQVAGPAQIWGEKTPDHLMWWRPIARAAPWMRFVVVVREPRAVVASTMAMPWAEDPRVPAWGDQVHLAFAQRWASSQRQCADLESELGASRCTVLRYEDVVAGPDATREHLGRFLGLTEPGALRAAPSQIAPEWEPWKRDALGAVTTERVDTWRETLGDRRSRDIQCVCRAGMRRFGYGDELPGVLCAAGDLVRIGPPSLARLTSYRRALRGYIKAIDRRVL